MRQKDIALIVFASGMSALIAFALGNYVLGGTNRSTNVETVQAITAEFQLPDSRFFNDNSLNPTTTIQIGDSNNPNPFKDSQGTQ
ncbi:hypothetical protein KC878_04530 [Candidatus Saccharibacteria bacterium]|nr:hypothetical protein [Candidatus Saccharibacteria bacterium]MCB9821231.1 hypothetical protein [Candidatus Nomurabacteria bacterium]